MNTDFLNAEDSFAVLANRLRLQILEKMDEQSGSHCSFSDLYQAVDATTTSQFSYHLKELTPQYVQQTNDGYAIRDSGRRLVESVRSGEHTVEPEFEPFSLSTHCPCCGETTASASYDGQLAQVDCTSCSTNLLRYDLRPAHVANRTSREALIAADRQMRAEYDTALAGVCQRCGGTITTELHTGSTAEPATASITCDCEHCGGSCTAPVEVALLTHPVVTAWFMDDGIDVRSIPLWNVLSELSKWRIETQGPNAVLVELSDTDRLQVQIRDGFDVQVIV